MITRLNCGKWEGCMPVNRFNHINCVHVVCYISSTRIDRPKSVPQLFWNRMCIYIFNIKICSKFKNQGIFQMVIMRFILFLITLNCIYLDKSLFVLQIIFLLCRVHLITLLVW